MFMHDHRKKPEGGYFCPLFREPCRDGWVPSMGMDKEKGTKPVCVAWRGVVVNDPQAAPPMYEVYDCTIGWVPDLLQQTAQESYHGSCETGEVRKAIVAQGGAMRRMNAIFGAIAERMRVKLPPPEKPMGAGEPPALPPAK